jgi:hypothetical protein
MRHTSYSITSHRTQAGDTTHQLTAAAMDSAFVAEVINGMDMLLGEDWMRCKFRVRVLVIVVIVVVAAVFAGCRLQKGECMCLLPLCESMCVSCLHGSLSDLTAGLHPTSDIHGVWRRRIPQ